MTANRNRFWRVALFVVAVVVLFVTFPLWGAFVSVLADTDDAHP